MPDPNANAAEDYADYLADGERDLLEWLLPENGQYGECHGKTLDAVIAKGFAEILSGREHQTPFIAKGDSLMYRAVAITDAGRAELNAPCHSCSGEARTGLPGNACESCMNTGMKYPRTALSSTQGPKS